MSEFVASDLSVLVCQIHGDQARDNQNCCLLEDARLLPNNPQFARSWRHYSRMPRARSKRAGHVPTYADRKNRTRTLCSALKLKTNRIIGQLHRQHHSQKFRKFPATIEADVPRSNHLRQRLALVFKSQHSGSVSSLVLEKRTLPRCFQPCD